MLTSSTWVKTAAAFESGKAVKEVSKESEISRFPVSLREIVYK